MFIPISLRCRRKAIYVRESYLQNRTGIGILSYLDCAAASYPYDTSADVPPRRVFGENIFLS
jgi:hypothetical protein